jgi:hypothetical protein
MVMADRPSPEAEPATDAADDGGSPELEREVAAIAAWFEALVALQDQRRCVGGCPIGSLASELADHEIPPPGESERGQLLRALASDAIRSGLERHFGVTLAFQNCHRVAAFRPSATSGARYRAFISARGQVLNQSPELRNC